jgi:hypothetical protein
MCYVGMVFCTVRGYRKGREWAQRGKKPGWGRNEIVFDRESRGGVKKGGLDRDSDG